MSKRIAVIGHKGFIGNNLVKSLKREDYDVVEMDLPDTDISDSQSFDLKGVDLVYHLAAYPLNDCKMNYKECMKTNILGTINVMEAIKKYKVKRMIYSSASSVYGNPVSLPVFEDALKQPLTFYGVCKLASENIIHYYFQDYSGTYGILRFTNIYGPGQQNGLVPTIIRNLLEGKEILITGNGTQTRDFLYIDDLVDILMRAIHHPMYSFTANVGSGKNVSVNEVITHISDILNIMPKLTYDHTPLHLDRKDFRASIDKLQSIYGNLNFTSIQNGIFKTIESY